MIEIFKTNYEDDLISLFQNNSELNKYKEIVIFGEFIGENSFAGRHEDEPHDIIFFDILCGHRQRKFLKPQDFIRTISDIVPVPKIVYEGALTDEFINYVRQNKFSLKEGVICKGIETNGAFVGNTWMCKIKTNDYIQKLKNLFGEEWAKYGE